MQFTRRDFIHAGCGIAVATLVPERAEAILHGSAIASLNSSRVTINAPSGYLNLAKGFGFTIDPNNQSSDGYPLTTPTSGTYTANPNLPLGYYGSFVWKWSGTGAMQWLAAPPLIVTSGGLDVFNLNSNSGDLAPGNISIVTQNLAVGATNPRVVFSVGWNIQSISNNGSGLIRVTTKTGFASSATTGLVVNIAGANTNTGANGTWTITAVDNQNFDLQSSTFTNAQASPAGTAIFAPQNNSFNFLSGFGTSFSGMANLVICKSSDETAITNGLITDGVLVSQLQFLMGTPGGVGRGSPGWLRFMDLSGVQSSYECDFSQRIPASYLCYGSPSFRPGYWTPSTNGAITNSGGDAYTCADPSVSTWNGSIYIDNAIVQGQFSATNAGGNPTLNVGGHGAKPIFDSSLNSIVFRISGPPASAGLSMVFTFNATWLNGGSNYTFTYVTVSGDTASISALNANLATALIADATLSGAGIVFTDSAQVVAMPRTAQAGRLSITYTSGPAICTIIRIDPSTFAASGNVTFVYNYLLDGWIYNAGGMINTVPLEAIADMCNQVGAHCWFNWGFTKGAWVTAVTNFFATNLNAGLKFGTEPWNEVWNFGAGPFARLQSLGFSLGFPNGSDAAPYSYTALRMIQYSALASAAWASAGRSASDFYTIQPSATFDVTANGNFDVAQLKGIYLNRSGGTLNSVPNNTIYGTYGGLNGSGSISANYNISPNRPVDITTATGCAPYWGSPWWGGSASSTDPITGTVTQNAPWLQASLDFTNGLISTAYTSLVNQFNGATLRSGGTDVGLSLATYYGGGSGVFVSEESLCAQYDSGRGALGLSPLKIIHYEGGPQWGMGASAINGVNSVNSGDISALVTAMTNLGWNVSPYTVSGTNNTTEAATQVITMVQAWKHDASYKTMIKSSYYQALITTSGSHRETRPAQFGYAASQWCLFPVSYPAGNQYTNYDAIHEFNA